MLKTIAINLIMLGLIGAGYWGKNLVREFYGLDVLHTVCDVDQELLNQHKISYPNINITKSYDDMLNNPEITMICISLPAQMHYDFGMKALNAGKHLYVEKPVTLIVEQAEELNSKAKELGLTFMVGHILHYHPAIETIKSIINKGTIGKIKYITSNRKSLGIYRTYENVLLSFAIHDISVILSLCKVTAEDVDRITCNGTSYITPGIHDIVNTTFFAKDVYININVDWCSPIKEQRLTIVCEKGLLVFDDVEKDNKLRWFPNHVKIENGIPSANKSEGIVVKLNGKSPLQAECEHFIECCRTGSIPITNGNEAINVLKVLKSCDSFLNPVSIIPIKPSVPKYFAHETACIESNNIGEGTKIWRWTHVDKTAEIGENCNIGQGCYIAGLIGNNIKIQNGVSIFKGVEIQDNCFIGPHSTFTNDINPRSEYGKAGVYIKTMIENGVSIGSNATIRCGVRLGKYCMIGCGAVITKNVEPYSVMVGNPARKIGTIDERGNRTLFVK